MSTLSTLSTLKLGTIEEEAAACRERWKNYDIGTLAAHLHHEEPFELLTKPAEARITYILSKKPENERALRLRCFAPIDLTKFPKLRKVSDALWEADTAWWKASDALRKASDALREADTAWWKVSDALRKADAVRWETGAVRWKANAAFKRIYAIPHAKLCPLGEDCPWDGETIFSN
jgi:hypothetical protein